MWVTRIFLWKEKIPPKSRSSPAQPLPVAPSRLGRALWAVWGGSNRCLDKAFSLEAFLGDTALSGSFKSRLCQIQRGRKSAIFQLSASVSKSKFAYWSWDLQNDSLQRLNPLRHAPAFCIFFFCCWLVGWFGFIFSNIPQFNGQAWWQLPRSSGEGLI